MSINNTHKNLDFKPDYALNSHVNYGYNKHVDWERFQATKNPAVAQTAAGQTTIRRIARKRP
jgi:hypothetical protein